MSYLHRFVSFSFSANHTTTESKHFGGDGSCYMLLHVKKIIEYYYFQVKNPFICNNVFHITLIPNLICPGPILSDGEYEKQSFRHNFQSWQTGERWPGFPSGPLLPRLPLIVSCIGGGWRLLADTVSYLLDHLSTGMLRIWRKWKMSRNAYLAKRRRSHFKFSNIDIFAIRMI